MMRALALIFHVKVMQYNGDDTRGHSNRVTKDSERQFTHFPVLK